MATETTGVRPMVFPMRRRAGLLGNFTMAQLSVAALGAGVGLSSIFASDPMQALTIRFIPAVLLIAAGLTLDQHGHPLISTIGRRALFTVRRLIGQTDYRRPVGVQPWQSAKLLLPGGLSAVQLLETDQGAIVENRANGTVAAVLELTAPGYALLDADDQADRIGAWALFLSTLVKHPGLARIQVLLPSRSSNPRQLREYFEAQACADVSAWAREQYETLLDAGVATSVRHSQFLVIVLDRARIAGDIRAQGGGWTGLASVLTREVETISGGVRECGLEVRRWLNVRELTAAVRFAYDPDAADQIDARAGEQRGVAPASAGPMAGVEEWDHIRVDAAFHRTFEVTEWPRIATLPDFLSAATTLQFPHALSLTFTPVPVKSSMSRIKRERGALESNADLRRRRGNLREDNAFERRERDDIERREQELVMGFGDLEFVGLVTVTGASLEELDANSSAFRTAVESRGMEVRPMYGEQVSGFNSASLPLAVAPAKTMSLGWGRR